MAVTAITAPLFNKLGPQITQTVCSGNDVALFDSAKPEVRAWGAAHARDDGWDLPAW